jgi:predicted transcriptional regulator
MEVQLLPDQQSQLDDLAARTGCTANERVQEPVAKLLDHDEWYVQQVQIAIDEIERGEFIEEEEMDAIVARMLEA